MSCLRICCDVSSCPLLLCNFWPTLTGDPARSTYYIARNVACLFLLFRLASYINPLERGNFGGYITHPWSKAILSATLWFAYWWFQSLVKAGLFCLGAFSSQIFSFASFMIWFLSAWRRPHVVVREQNSQSLYWVDLAHGISTSNSRHLWLDVRSSTFWFRIFLGVPPIMSIM